MKIARNNAVVNTFLATWGGAKNILSRVNDIILYMVLLCDGLKNVIIALYRQLSHFQVIEVSEKFWVPKGQDFLQIGIFSHKTRFFSHHLLLPWGSTMEARFFVT